MMERLAFVTGQFVTWFVTGVGMIINAASTMATCAT